MAKTAGETNDQDSTDTLAEQDVVADDIWDEDESPALRRARKEAEFTAGGDSTRAYLKQIGRVPLLSAAEEVDLAVRIEVGLYAVQKLQAECEGPSGLTIARHRDLTWLVQDGIAAKDHLLEANLRLVVSIAKRYTGRGMAFLDLIQEGNLGLVRAVEKFDYSRGFDSAFTMRRYVHSQDDALRAAAKTWNTVVTTRDNLPGTGRKRERHDQHETAG